MRFTLRGRSDYEMQFRVKIVVDPSITRMTATIRPSVFIQLCCISITSFVGILFPICESEDISPPKQSLGQFIIRLVCQLGTVAVRWFSFNVVVEMPEDDAEQSVKQIEEKENNKGESRGETSR